MAAPRRLRHPGTVTVRGDPIQVVDVSGVPAGADVPDEDVVAEEPDRLTGWADRVARLGAGLPRRWRVAGVLALSVAALGGFAVGRASAPSPARPGPAVAVADAGTASTAPVPDATAPRIGQVVNGSCGGVSGSRFLPSVPHALVSALVKHLPLFAVESGSRAVTESGADCMDTVIAHSGNRITLTMTVTATTDYLPSVTMRSSGTDEDRIDAVTVVLDSGWNITVQSIGGQSPFPSMASLVALARDPSLIPRRH